jgi:hypothetical protein
MKRDTPTHEEYKEQLWRNLLDHSEANRLDGYQRGYSEGFRDGGSLACVVWIIVELLRWAL